MPLENQIARFLSEEIHPGFNIVVDAMVFSKEEIYKVGPYQL